MDKQQATEEVAVLLKKAKLSLEQAKVIADEAGITFSFDLGAADNVDRVIGGQYYGKGIELDEDGLYDVRDEWGDNDHLEAIDEDEEEGTVTYRLTRGAWSAWQSSSEQC
jgi:hypothetical protein